MQPRCIQQQIYASEQEKNKQYNFSYIDGFPHSLIVTKCAKQLMKLLYKMPLYIWIKATAQKDNEFKARFQKIIGQPLTIYQNTQQARDQIQSYECIAVICQQSIAFNLSKQLSHKFKQNHISRVFTYNAQFPSLLDTINPEIHYIFMPACSSLDDLLSQVKQESKFNYQAKHYLNFVSIKNETQDSNTLIRTNFIMTQYFANRQQMAEHLKRLAILYAPIQQNAIQNYVQIASLGPIPQEKAIQLYSQQSFLYSLVNSIFRSSRDPTQIFIIQPFFQDLFKAVKKYYKEQSKQRKQPLKCFRGGFISQKQFSQLQNNVGGIVKNLGFLSTSKQVTIAKGFIINTLFEIQVPNEQRNPQNDYGFAEIENVSDSIHELEVLFNPLNSFKVVSAKLQENIYEIKLIYGILANQVALSQQMFHGNLSQTQVLGLQQIQHNHEMNCLGTMIYQLFGIDDGQNKSLVLEFWHKFIEIAQKANRYHEMHHGYQYLALQYKKQLDFAQAQLYFQKSRQMFQNHIGLDNVHYFQFVLQQTSFQFQLDKDLEKCLKKLSGCDKILKQIGHLQFNYLCILLQTIFSMQNCQALPQYKFTTQFYQRYKQIFQKSSDRLQFIHFRNVCKIILSAIKFRHFVSSSKTLALKNQEISNNLDNLLQLQKQIKVLKGKKTCQYCSMLHLIAGSLQQLQLFSQSVKYYEQAIKIIQENKLIKRNFSLYFTCIAGSAATYIKMKQFKKVRQQLTKFVKINKQYETYCQLRPVKFLGFTSKNLDKALQYINLMQNLTNIKCKCMHDSCYYQQLKQNYKKQQQLQSFLDQNPKQQQPQILSSTGLENYNQTTKISKIINKQMTILFDKFVTCKQIISKLTLQKKWQEAVDLYDSIKKQIENSQICVNEKYRRVLYLQIFRISQDKNVVYYMISGLFADIVICYVFLGDIPKIIQHYQLFEKYQENKQQHNIIHLNLLFNVLSKLYYDYFEHPDEQKKKIILKYTDKFVEKLKKFPLDPKKIPNSYFYMEKVKNLLINIYIRFFTLAEVFYVQARFSLGKSQQLYRFQSVPNAQKGHPIDPSIGIGSVLKGILSVMEMQVTRVDQLENHKLLLNKFYTMCKKQQKQNKLCLQNGLFLLRQFLRIYGIKNKQNYKQVEQFMRKQVENKQQVQYMEI